MGGGVSKLIEIVWSSAVSGDSETGIRITAGARNPVLREDSTTAKPVAVAEHDEGVLDSEPVHELRFRCNSPQQSYAHTPSTDRSRVSEQRNLKENPAANIVIFGETGVGKSSVINLIANQKLAHTSNDAVGCTFRYERYPIMLGSIPCTLWDTVGLDEGSEGTVPAEEAESNLKELIQELAHSGGIHLVIYCIRGTRLTRALKRNYDLFYGTACRRKVPVALVVTGLEHQRGGMESWWTENEEELRRNGMWFDAHACITTLNVMDDDIQQRRTESRTLLCELVVRYSALPAWKIDSSFLSPALPLLHNAFQRIYSAGRAGRTTARRKVIICGPCSMFHPRPASNTRYELVRVDKYALDAIKPRMCEGVGLLLFCASILVDNRISLSDIYALKKFYDLAGGQNRPVIVALEGCNDDQVALACQVEVATRHRDIQAHFVAIPSSNGAGAKLDEMINILYLE